MPVGIGEIQMAKSKVNGLTRFWKKVKVNKLTGCWNWRGEDETYYPKFMRDDGTLQYAHRWSYENFKSAIPEGLCALHKCDNKRCVNPDHLFLGTQADNMADKVAKGRGCKGITHGRAKLSEQDVIHIRASNKKGTELASEYNVSQQLISFIINRKIWTHLPA